MTKNVKHELCKVANLVNCYKEERKIVDKIIAMDWEEKEKRYGSLDKAWENIKVMQTVAEHTYIKALNRAITNAESEVWLAVIKTDFIDKCLKAR